MKSVNIKAGTPVHYRLLELLESGKPWIYENKPHKLISVLPIYGSDFVRVELEEVDEK